ncbi:MAG: hypothetical protein NVS4B3_13650 [Gemmatimonadaceae bacterium]
MAGDDERGNAAHATTARGGPKEVDAGPGAGAYAAVGLEFALALVLFAFAGQWLDRRLGTAPWLLISSIFLGGGGAFYSMVRSLTAAQARKDAARSAPPPETRG